MAFNSYGFALLFLPVVWLIYGLVARFAGRRGRLMVIIAAGLAFYVIACAWALPILLASLLGNYLVARMIIASNGDIRRCWLRLGVGTNVLALVALKFSGFMGANLALLIPGPPLLRELALPLGISFFTFQQISLLVDLSRGLVTSLRPLTYLASILFFPYLVSGPITYFREFAPQVETETRDTVRDGIAGLTLFATGLFKKAVLADTLVLWVDPMFADVAAGHRPVVVQAWVMVLGFLFQMYFDFSGYSDMAAGTARLLGVRLPLNFYSPIRVTNIMDWWRRWHMSLGRFVNDYIFQSLALPMTRMAMMRGYGRWGGVVLGVLVPTAVSMFVIGAWHGGNWTYITFGLLHAFYMVVAEAWIFLRKKNRKRKRAPPTSRLAHVRGHVLTMLCVLIALVPFRAPDMASALRVWAGMAGIGGAGVWLPWPVMPTVGGAIVALELALSLAIVYVLPNTAQWLEQLDIALPFAGAEKIARGLIPLVWRPNAVWGIVTGAMLLLGLTFVSRGGNSFVYFSF
ncbi:D-alanyl-lipoteichoic acid acyltransferase DltB (MBOAT superfamily) [Novosphingobium sediminicola]|uniref:Probable alginate O-acetylase AlgI n=1 Tax=Novosphingobium sediminicola TaxID=563162 RepID=A0A7W6CLW6_9SPHN|nr:MBOAT family protein [Novosphingobium sediminicola]MBB3956828.1 D-alanyl-lipoteichoic acid acyltransferase DltB (MBOAT superfamily) [Novosphingobium sediminicola]